MKKFLCGEYYRILNVMLILKVFGNVEKFNMVISKENILFVYEYIVEDNVIVFVVLYGEIVLEIGNILF